MTGDNGTPKRDPSRKELAKNKPPGRRPAIKNIMRFQRAAYDSFLNLIRLGAYDYVAAEKLGITSRTFLRWINQGKEEAERWQAFAEELEGNEDLDDEAKDLEWEAAYEPSCYCRFFLDVMQAKAESRSMREMQVANDSPFQWLRYGPGRTRPGREGWTDVKEDMSELDITLVDGNVPIKLNLDEEGREIVAPKDMVETIKVLHESLYMPSLPEMAKAILAKEPDIIDAINVEESKPANDKSADDNSNNGDE